MIRKTVSTEQYEAGRLLLSSYKKGVRHVEVTYGGLHCLRLGRASTTAEPQTTVTRLRAGAEREAENVGPAHAPTRCHS